MVPGQEFRQKLLGISFENPHDATVFDICLCIVRFCIDEILDECFEAEALEKVLALLMCVNVDGFDVVVSASLSARSRSSVSTTFPEQNKVLPVVRLNQESIWALGHCGPKSNRVQCKSNSAYQSRTSPATSS